MSKKKKIAQPVVPLNYKNPHNIDITVTPNSEGRLGSEDEILIANSLILYKGDTAEVAEHCHTSIDIVSKIYLKYYYDIQHCMKKDIKNSKINKTIETTLSIMQDSISDIRARQLETDSRYVKNSDITTLVRLVDRLLAIKNSVVMGYTSTTSEMHKRIIESKTTEKMEQGIILNDTSSISNQATVLEQLKHNSLGKETTVINVETGATKAFFTIKEAADYLSGDRAYLAKIANTDKLYKNKFKITMANNYRYDKDEYQDEP